MVRQSKGGRGGPGWFERIKILAIDNYLAAADSLQNQQILQKQRPRGRPFVKGQSGNPAGRPAGKRNRATRAVEALLAGEAEALTRKAVEMALGGNAVALKLCLERLAAPQREPPASLQLPTLRAAAELPGAMAALAAAVSRGGLSAGEAEAFGRLLQGFARLFEACEVEARVKQVEATVARLSQP